MAAPVPVCTWETVNWWTWWLDTWTADPAAWVGSIATFAATLVALWFGVMQPRSERKMKDEENRRYVKRFVLDLSDLLEAKWAVINFQAAGWRATDVGMREAGHLDQRAQEISIAL